METRKIILYNELEVNKCPHCNIEFVVLFIWGENAKEAEPVYCYHCGKGLGEEAHDVVVIRGWEVDKHKSGNETETGWSIYHRNMGVFLHKNLETHFDTGWDWEHKHGEAPGYWPSKEAAVASLEDYLKREERKLCISINVPRRFCEFPHCRVSDTKCVDCPLKANT